MSDVVFSPWYINTRRLSDLTKTALSSRAQTSVAHNHSDRVEAMSVARFLAQKLVASGKLNNVADLIGKGLFPGTVVAGVWANAIFRGAGTAFKASEKGRPGSKASFSVQLVIGDSTCWLDGSLEIEHFYSFSSVGYLSGRKQIYVVGQLELKDGSPRGVIHPWLIGDLLEAIDLDQSLPLSWGYASNVHPGAIDAFARISNFRAPAERPLRSIMLGIPEAQVKAALAEIIGEPFVPKDWGGEHSDLFTSRLTIDGVPANAAFLLKGPSVPGPMHVADLGKRGDQIVRLFDEPADLLILQHCNKIETAVVKTMRAFAVDPKHPRRFCIIDGADTYRILRAYGYLDANGLFSTRTVASRRKVKST
jgi:hypothetical protein